MSYPDEISPDETLVRIVRAPQFIRTGGKLRAAALRPQRDHDRVSVVRWVYREQPGRAFKARCQAVGNSGSNTYCGLGSVNAGKCVEAGTALEDARQEFLGHAHIIFPFSVAHQEPAEGEAFRQQMEISSRLLAATIYIADPLPDDPEWTIESELLPTE